MAPIPTSVKYRFWLFKIQKPKAYEKTSQRDQASGTPEQILLIFSCCPDITLHMLSITTVRQRCTCNAWKTVKGE